MNENNFQINYEIFYADEHDIQKEIENLSSLHSIQKSTRIDVFDLSNDEHVNYYNTKGDPYYYKKIINSEETQYPVNITQDDFKRAFRKFFRTRLHSKVFKLEPWIIAKTEETENDIMFNVDVNFIRGPKTVVLANVKVFGAEKPNDDIIKNIKAYLQDRLAYSTLGKISQVTPVKISSVQSSYIIPFKKLMPRIASIRLCKKLADIVEPSNKEIFEYKWALLKTGIIIVQERYGKLVNPITGNEIDPMYIEQIYPAFDTDILLHLLNKPYDITVYSGGGNISDQMARQVLWEYDHNKTITKKTINDRICSYYGRRYQFINFYEKLRMSKRALAMMGKDIM